MVTRHGEVNERGLGKDGKAGEQNQRDISLCKPTHVRRAPASLSCIQANHSTLRRPKPDGQAVAVDVFHQFFCFLILSRFRRLDNFRPIARSKLRLAALRGTRPPPDDPLTFSTGLIIRGGCISALRDAVSRCLASKGGRTCVGEHPIFGRVLINSATVPRDSTA